MIASLPSWLLALGGPAELIAKITIVLLAAAVAARLLKGSSAGARHLAWRLGIVAALVLPVATLVVPATRVPLPVVESSASTPGTRIASAPAPADPGAVSALPRTPRDPAAFSRLQPLGVLLALWTLGTLVMSARLVTSMLRAARLSRRARPSGCDETFARGVRLRESDRVSVPMTFGALRPVVLVPAGFASWDAQRRADVLLHELAHVRRGDWLWQLVGRCACALLWFHPLAHLASRRLRDEAEQAADDLVLASGTRPSAYASHLIDLVRSRKPLPRSEAMTVSMIGGPFDSRIRAILDSSRARGPASTRLRAALVASAAACVLLLSAVDVSAEPSPSTPWQHVKDAWRAHVDWATTPDDGAEWYDRGMQRHAEGRYEEAVEAFERAIEMGARRAGSSYNVACGMARLGRTDEAFAWLAKAEDAGFGLAPYLSEDEDLASLRQDSRFTALAERHADDMRRAGLERKADAAHLRTPPDSESPTTIYNLACKHAVEGRRDEALRHLELAIAAGWDDADFARRDEDLASLRGDERFEKLLEDAELLGTPREMNVMGFEIAPDPADWQRTAERHQAFVAAHPDSGAGWFQLGFALLRSGDPDAALAAYEHARELKHRPEVAAYNIACCHAVSGRDDAAFQWLEQAASEGFDVAGHASGDEDLANLRDDERFRPYEGHVKKMLRRLVEY